MTPEHPGRDLDFSRQVLEDLYAYRHKRRDVAWLLWATLGWLGAHRFYLGRDFSGVAMLFTGGGGLLWWLADTVLLSRMVQSHNEEQEARKRAGLPPVQMDFMPPLRDAVLRKTPPWVERWKARSSGRRAVRLGGDVLVLLVAGFALGSLVGMDGALEATVVVVLLAITTTLGAGPSWLDGVPLFASLERWAHRLRLFYYHNGPASPPGLLLRSVIGMMWAPFRAKDRTEVKLYVELGAVFTAGFLLLDVVSDVIVPVASGASLELTPLLAGWVSEAFVTFFLIYAFAAPVGAVLTLYLLVRPTHTLPRILAAAAMSALAAGALALA